ncbi:MAG: hypothetical protein JST21_12515 [Bacteroidetes bacterium]|nr:hypothetical protein [Bacteroidota bacterium]
MKEKIQLVHPQGKQLSSIDADKYTLLKKAILASLSKKASITHTALLEKVLVYFNAKNVSFEGSVEWYLEGVKLDLEANGFISRIKEGNKFLFLKK